MRILMMVRLMRSVMSFLVGCEVCFFGVVC
jgi:hypothetical protein